MRRLKWLGGPRSAADLETFPLGPETPKHGVRSAVPVQRVEADYLALEHVMIEQSKSDTPEERFLAEGILLGLRWGRYAIPTSTVLASFDNSEQCCEIGTDGGCAHVRPL